MDPTKRRIRKIDRDVQRFVAHALHNTSLSLSDYEMVQTVHHRPGITQGELCRRYSQDKSTVARRAAKLEREGYIQRLPSEEDRRSKHLFVTEKGQALRNQKIDAEAFYFSWLTAELSEEELAVLIGALRDILDSAVHCFQEDDPAAAGEVEPLEEAIDQLIEAVRDRHIRRLQSGRCTIQMGFVLNDLLTNFERVSDHCSNIAVSVIQEQDGGLDSHTYLHTVKSSSSFDAELRRDLKKYRLPEET